MLTWNDQAGWLIAFVSSIIGALDKTNSNGFPNYCWWTLVFTLFVIIGVFIAVGSDTIPTYRIAIVGYLGAGLVMATSSVNSLIYRSQGSSEAAAAGFILLSMVCVSCILTSRDSSTR